MHAGRMHCRHSPIMRTPGLCIVGIHPFCSPILDLYMTLIRKPGVCIVGIRLQYAHQTSIYSTVTRRRVLSK